MIAIHAALLFAVLHHWGVASIDQIGPSALRVFDFAPPPPPPPPPPPQQKQQPKPKDKEGGAAPPNIRSQATPVVAPKPKIVDSAAAANRRERNSAPGNCADARRGRVAGPGTGAGGAGTGTGSGSGGSGTGGGGDDGVAEPPHLVTPMLTGPGFRPRPARAMAARRDRVPALAGGRARLCQRMRGRSRHRRRGDQLGAMCNLAHDRLRFRPALNRSGQAVAGWFGYAQRAPR